MQYLTPLLFPELERHGELNKHAPRHYANLGCPHATGVGSRKAPHNSVPTSCPRKLQKTAMTNDGDNRICKATKEKIALLPQEMSKNWDREALKVLAGAEGQTIHSTSPHPTANNLRGQIPNRERGT